MAIAVSDCELSGDLQEARVSDGRDRHSGSRNVMRVSCERDTTERRTARMDNEKRLQKLPESELDPVSGGAGGGSGAAMSGSDEGNNGSNGSPGI